MERVDEDVYLLSNVRVLGRRVWGMLECVWRGFGELDVVSQREKQKLRGT